VDRQTDGWMNREMGKTPNVVY